ncbi:hypothetical protein G7054_g13908 [Neopestalotiopsis clavispora]|nr:hypothetical protein G7054_g13908 [Neopestalotiopsis clavispora]
MIIETCGGPPSVTLSIATSFSSTFFHNTYLTLRAEIFTLSSIQRASFPRFSSIQDLLALHSRESLHPALHHALVCSLQLALFISRCGEGDDIFAQKTDVYLLGLCTGSLTAAAVAAARNVSDLLRLAPHTVGVAFRTTIRAHEVGQSLESGSTEPWSVIVANYNECKVRALIDQFCDERLLPAMSRPYLSFVARDCVTISGPPSILRCLKDSASTGLSTMDLDLRVPYHAPHLFVNEDVDAVLSTTFDGSWTRYKSQAPVISSTTGKVSNARDYPGLLRDAVRDILMHPINWQDVVKDVAYLSHFSYEATLSIHGVATGRDTHLRNILKEHGYKSETSNLSFEPGPHVPETSVREPSSGAFASASGKSKIAIVGFSGRFPEAEDPDAFWDIIFRGLDVHKVVPTERWNAATHVDTSGGRKNTSGTSFGCWIKNPGYFDTKFFNISPREAPQMDPASRLALMTVYEAMENAGMVPGTTPSTMNDRVGVAFGVSANDWMEVNSAQNIDTFFIPGGCRAFVPGRINYFFKLTGPSLSLDTACSSSLAAINTACNALWQGDIDTAIAGGSNVLTNPDYTAGLDRGHFLSRTGNCKSFDQTADGYCRADATCAVILKRLDDAIAEKDPILGVILAAGTNHSAEADSITRPVDPVDVSYVEMHGTGTRTGDPIEMRSVVDTCAPAYRRPANRPLYVGAVKSNVGHGEGAAGVTSLAKVLLMMRHNTIPPHAGLRTTLNKDFPVDLSERNVRVAHQPIEWTPGQKATGPLRRVLVNNFSAAGGNSALLLEDAPPASRHPAVRPNLDLRSSHIVAVSAKTPNSLKRNVEALLSFLEKGVSPPMNRGGIALPALSYTTTARRFHHAYRVAVRGERIEQVQSELQALLSRDDSSVSRNASPTAPPITFVFTGNGAQYGGMGSELLKTMPTFRDDVERLDRIVQSQGFDSIIPVLRDATNASSGDSDSIGSQLGVVVLQLALARLWISWGIRPANVTGHSLGLYPALVVAGVLSEADALCLVGRRAELLQKHCRLGSHSMLAVRGASQDIIDHVLADLGQVELACINGPADIVLSGATDALQQVAYQIQGKIITAKMLTVPYAFHSIQVEPMLDEFETACRGVVFHEPALPIICPLLGSIIKEAKVVSPRYLRDHCRKPVDMLGALRFARAAGVLSSGYVTIEMGPQPTVTGMIRNTLGPTFMTTLASLRRGQNAFDTSTESLCILYNMGCNIDWREYHADFPGAHQVVQLPAYRWDLKNYWIQYVNDWSLRKGDPMPSGNTIPLLAELPQAMPPVQVVPPLQGILIHRVIEDRIDTIIVETDLSRPDTRPLAQGHRVNGIPLATPALYSNIALLMGQHIAAKQAIPPAEEIVTIENMVVERALVAHGGPGPQILRSTAMIDIASGLATCCFETIGDGTRAPRQHATCRLVRISRQAALADLEASILPSAVQRIKILSQEARQATQSSSVFRFSKSMTYRMVGSLATFDEDYRRINEITLDSSSMDAASIVSCVGLTSSADISPAALDALAQSAGFIMNAHEAADLETEVHINHGWTSFQLFEKLDISKTYRTYCKMLGMPEKRLWKGDCVVLDGDSDSIVAYFAGITLQGVPRRALQLILSGESRSSASTQLEKDRIHPLQLSGDAKESDELPLVYHKKQSSFSHLTATPINLGQPDSPRYTTSFAHEMPHVDVQLEREMEGTLGLATMSINAPQKTSGSASTLAYTEDLATKALRIISEESGVSLEELTDDVVFAGMGIDSLMSLMVTARLRDELAVEGADLPDISLFSGGPTVGDLKRYLNASDTSRVSSPTTQVLPDLGPPTSISVPVRSATSVILQGRPLSDRHVLWLFPDGSGSAVSYKFMASSVRAGLAVVGLNCPYYRHPEELATGLIPLVTLVDAYLAEMRRRQPNGPYHVGGWSSGGILAFAAAQRLIREGERVDSLILIDAPPPTGLDPLPDRWYAHCQASGIFGSSNGHTDEPHYSQDTINGNNSQLMAHFQAQVQVLRHYVAKPLPEGLTPRTSIVWAGRCTFDGRPGRPVFEMRQGDPQGITFLTQPRIDWTAGEWAPLFPFDEPVVVVMNDCDHFSIVQKGNGNKMAKFISDAVF